jgi:disulfide bond formation protein DsbB
MISDGMVVAIVCGVAVAAAGLLARRLARKKTRWSRGRIALVAALPMPFMLAVLPLGLWLDAWLASDEECGVDACGMVMMAALLALIGVLVVFLLSVLIAWLSQAKGRA